VSAKLKKVWDEEESPRAGGGGGKAPLQESRYIVLDVVARNNECLGLAGPIQD